MKERTGAVMAKMMPINIGKVIVTAIFAGATYLLLYSFSPGISMKSYAFLFWLVLLGVYGLAICCDWKARRKPSPDASDVWEARDKETLLDIIRASTTSDNIFRKCLSVFFLALTAISSILIISRAIMFTRIWLIPIIFVGLLGSGFAYYVIRRFSNVSCVNKPRMFLIIMTCIALANVAVQYCFGSPQYREDEYRKLARISQGAIDDIPSGIGGTMIIDEMSAIGEIDQMSAFGEISAAVSNDIVFATQLERMLSWRLSDGSFVNINGQPRIFAPLKRTVISGDGMEGSAVLDYAAIDPVNKNTSHVEYEGSGVACGNTTKAMLKLLYRKYPSLLFVRDCVHFEADDEGEGWIVAPVYDYTIGLYGGKDIVGVVVMDPFGDHESVYYDLGSVPEWVDIVFPWSFFDEQYRRGGEIFGELNYHLDGFWRETLYGRMAIGDDIYAFSGVGVSSLNFGFIFLNQRTGEATYIDYPSINVGFANNSVSAASDYPMYDYCKCESCNCCSVCDFCGMPAIVRMQMGGDKSCVVYVGALREWRYIKQYYIVDAETGLTVAFGETIDEAVREFKKIYSP